MATKKKKKKKRLIKDLSDKRHILSDKDNLIKKGVKESKNG